MSKRVKKHCSILNYIRRADEDLYELVQDLCIGRMLVPRKGTPGLTFLRPDKSLMAKIKTMATGDDPEEAVAVLQSLVLLDNLPTLGDFEDKKDDIPTFLRKKLPVASVDDKKVLLNNGAAITLDTDFEHRKDRPNMTVYVISKALVPTDTAASDFSNAKPNNNRKVKGGAEYQNNKKALFENVLARHCDPNKMKKGNPALEVLCSLCDFVKKTRGSGSEDYLAITSQLSWDTVASLAIILQPYRGENPDLTYVPNELFTAWVDNSSLTVSSENAMNTINDIFYYHDNPVSMYTGHMAHGEECKMGDYTDFRAAACEQASKLSVVSQIAGVYTQMKGVIGSQKRRNVLSNGKLALAESELRVFSAILHDSSIGCFEMDEAKALYTAKFNLIEPYMVNQKKHIDMSNIGFYFSSAYLIVRSDALVYCPNTTDGKPLSSIADENSLIRLDYDLEQQLRNSECFSTRAEELDRLEEMLSAWRVSRAPVVSAPATEPVE